MRRGTSCRISSIASTLPRIPTSRSVVVSRISPSLPLGGYVEFATLVSTDADSDWLGIIDVGLTYAVTENIQLDAGVNLGVTPRCRRCESLRRPFDSHYDRRGPQTCSWKRRLGKRRARSRINAPTVCRALQNGRGRYMRLSFLVTRLSAATVSSLR